MVSTFMRVELLGQQGCAFRIPNPDCRLPIAELVKLGPNEV